MTFKQIARPITLKDRMFRQPVTWQLYQKFNKYTYPYFTRWLGDEEALFLNYGYEEDPPMNVPLTCSDEPNRFCIQLYHRTATQADVSGQKVLEVGCGHGGGASYIMRALKPASYTGLDLNRAGVAFCQDRYDLPGLDFVRGDAENLPFDDQDFDAVINIESSHCYSHFPRFLAEAARVLRAGGHFLYADLRPRGRIADWEAALADAPMQLISVRDIGEEVLRGMERNWAPVLDLIDRRIPPLFRGFARDISGVQDSYAYNDLQRGGLLYRMYCFVKD